MTYFYLLPEVENLLDDDIAVHVNLIHSSLPVMPQTLSEVKEVSESDNTISSLMSYCLHVCFLAKKQIFSP